MNIKTYPRITDPLASLRALLTRPSGVTKRRFLQWTRKNRAYVDSRIGSSRIGELLYSHSLFIVLPDNEEVSTDELVRYDDNHGHCSIIGFNEDFLLKNGSWKYIYSRSSHISLEDAFELATKYIKDGKLIMNRNRRRVLRHILVSDQREKISFMTFCIRIRHIMNLSIVTK